MTGTQLQGVSANQILPGQNGVIATDQQRAGNAIINAANNGINANNAYVNQGQSFIQNATGQAGQYLGYGYGQSMQDVGQQPNRVADLYNGGLGAGFTPDPNYQFRLQQGQNAIMHNASATGGRHGGNTLRAMTDFNKGMASGAFNDYANRQLGLATGADQTDWARNTYLGNAAQNYGQNMSNLYTGQGAQLASLGMQGAAQNTGLNQSQINGLIPPAQQSKGPSGTQQLLGLGAMAVGTYFGGPMAGAAAGKVVGGY